MDTAFRLAIESQTMSINGHRDSISPEVRARQTWPGAIVGYAVAYEAGHDTGEHAHERAQFMLSLGGVLTLRTETGAWVVPPGFAIWVPGGLAHRATAATEVNARFLYVTTGTSGLDPSEIQVVQAGGLLRALVERVVELPEAYPDDGPETRLVAVLRDELARLEPAPLDLPLPRDRRALAVAEALIEDAGDERGIDDWGRVAGASGRTLARLFQAETGFTFGQWRQRRRLLAALERLAAGEPVTTIALDLGYAGTSAFTAMFRRQLGAPPTRYLREG